MDRNLPLDRLSVPYALALRLRAAGADAALIADCLEVDVTAVPALLALADAKLADVEQGETAVARAAASGSQ